MSPKAKTAVVTGGDTPMTRGSPIDVDATATASPMKPPGRPEDIAAACAFLASDAETCLDIIRRWRDAGGASVGVRIMGLGFDTAQQHIDYLAEVPPAPRLSRPAPELNFQFKCASVFLLTVERGPRAASHWPVQSHGSGRFMVRAEAGVGVAETSIREVQMSVIIEPIKPRIGGRVRVEKARLCDDDVVAAVRAALEERGVLVFPEIHVSDQEQLAFTDRLGERVNFTRRVPGSDASAEGVYKITLDEELNDEPDYVLGTFFWHVDGVTMDMPLPKATLLSARALAASGGATEFANLFAAYETLSAEERQQLEGLRVIHTLEAGLRPVWGHPPQERRDRWRGMTVPMEHPLVWTHTDGRRSLLLGTHADGVVGMSAAHGRALLWRLQQWAAQPDYVYSHQWRAGDMVLWNNEGLMHRVIPYTDARRSMHRTTIAGHAKPGRPAGEKDVARTLQPIG